MTSRVQKGSTVFRPVAKSRNRTAPSAVRQESVAVEFGVSLPASDLLPASSEPSSHIFSAPEDQPAVTSGQEITPLISARPIDGEIFADNVDAVYESHSVPSSNTIAPAIVPFPANDGMRSRSAVPMVIATPRNSQTPTQNPLWPSSQRSFAKDILPSGSSRLAVETGQLPSIITVTVPSTSTTLVPDDNEGPSSPLETSHAPTALTDYNSAAPIPNEQEPLAKAAPRKRKTPSRNTKESQKRAGESGDAEDTENLQEGTSTKRPRSRASSRASSSTPRPRKRAPSPPAYDPDADPGEDLDPTSVTMAELCSDTGQGRVSRKAAEILSNHAAWKAKNREKRVRMKQVMEAKKYGREEELEDNEEGEGQGEPRATPAVEAGSSNVAITDDTGNGFDYSQDLATSRFNVQVRIGPNGETVIDEESLVVDRAENDGTENYTHVIESDQTKFVNSGSYGKRYRGSRWSAEETELFYDALSQYGENYELIAYVLPGRDRKSCKNKFKVEDKRNPARINHCLNNSIPVDMKTLSRMTGKDFSGPVPEIRVPPPMPPPPIAETEGSSSNVSAENISPRVKKRSRSRSRGGAESGVVVLGDAETFEG